MNIIVTECFPVGLLKHLYDFVLQKINTLLKVTVLVHQKASSFFTEFPFFVLCKIYFLRPFHDCKSFSEELLISPDHCNHVLIISPSLEQN